MGLPNEVRAVITGGGSGLGRAFAVEIAERGGLVVVSDVDGPRAEEVANEIAATGGRAFGFECDVTDLEQVRALSAEATRRMGGVDMIINNAGVAVGGPLDEIGIEDWRWIVDVNLWGVIHGVHVFYPQLKRQGHGYVVNVASAAGLLAPPELGPYNVTKASVIALSETLHAEARSHGVNVSVLCPTFFKTGILDAARGVVREDARRMVTRLMERSKVQAPEVARAALDAVAAGRLYAVPMADGLLFWALKRLLPGRFHNLAGAMQMLQRSRLGQ